MKRSNSNSESKTTSKSDQLVIPSLKETEVVKFESNTEKHEIVEECAMSEDICGSVAKKMKKMKKSSRKSSGKIRIEELYEPDVSIAAKKDIDLERKLSKKLKVKEGRLSGMDDGLNILLDGMSSFNDFIGEGEVPGSSELPLKKRSKKSSSSKKLKEDVLSKEGMEAESIAGMLLPVEASNQDGASEVPGGIASRKKNKKRKLSGQQQEDNVDDDTVCIFKPLESHGTDVASEDVPAEVLVKKAKEKYIAPHLRARAGNEPEEHTQIRRRVRGKNERPCFDIAFLISNCIPLIVFLDLNLFFRPS